MIIDIIDSVPPPTTPIVDIVFAIILIIIIINDGNNVVSSVKGTTANGITTDKIIRCCGRGRGRCSYSCHSLIIDINIVIISFR